MQRAPAFTHEDHEHIPSWDALIRDQPRGTCHHSGMTKHNLFHTCPSWHKSRASSLCLQGQIQSLWTSNVSFSSISSMSKHHSVSFLSTYRAAFVSRCFGCEAYKRVRFAALSNSEAKPGKQCMNHSCIAQKLLQQCCTPRKIFQWNLFSVPLPKLPQAGMSMYPSHWLHCDPCRLVHGDFQQHAHMPHKKKRTEHAQSWGQAHGLVSIPKVDSTLYFRQEDLKMKFTLLTEQWTAFSQLQQLKSSLNSKAPKCIYNCVSALSI